MNQSENDDVLTLSKNQGRFLLFFIGLLVAFGIADLIDDFHDGAELLHLGLEFCGVAVGIFTATWIIRQNQRLTRHGVLLRSRLDKVRQEAKTWRDTSQSLLKGLGVAIDSQLRDWQLSDAEREVALLLLKGLAMKEIASARGTSERTTRQQAHEVYRKSGLGGRAEFSAFFLEDLLLPMQEQPKHPL